MSESVWFEQVDTALISYIQSIVHYGGNPIPVSVRKPEEDFKIEIYPSMSIYNVFSQLDLERSDTLQVIKSIDKENYTMVLEKSAIPFNLTYQIDFWAKYQEDMNRMTQLWLGHTGRDFNLPVFDASGNERSSFVLMTDQLVKSDFIDGSDRVYHSAVTYRIYVELDENIQIVKPLIAGTETNVIKTS